METRDGNLFDRNCAYARYVVQEPSSYQFNSVFFDSVYEFKHSRPAPVQTPKIYEAHVGMSGEKPRISTYTEFRDNVLPRVKEMGFNIIQLMAIPEHAYYGSYGYHITNLFASSSKFGTPDDLKSLIDTAHSLGILVYLDLCLSHASRNANDGIADMDGTGNMYFYPLPRGYQEQWDAKIYDVTKLEVQRFLLSNVRYWVEEFKVDGFRMDAVTSMIYLHHGYFVTFTGSLTDYFNHMLDLDALALLKLVTRTGKSAHKDVKFIAEEVTGFPLLCVPETDSGIGFDYTLAMYNPDFCIKLVNDFHHNQRFTISDQIPGAFLNRKDNEKYIGYAESHDQCISGHQSLLSDLVAPQKALEALKYPLSKRVNICLSVWKAITCLSILLGGEGGLVFMGNEFGHPDWLEAPTEHNNGSYDKARRIWSLADLPTHAFGELRNFTKELLKFKSKFHEDDASLIEEEKRGKVLSYRDPLLIKRGKYMVRIEVNIAQSHGQPVGKKVFITCNPEEENDTYIWVVVEEIESKK